MASAEGAIDFDVWAKEIGLNEKTVGILKAEDAASMNVSLILNENEIASLGLTVGQRALLREGIKRAKSREEDKELKTPLSSPCEDIHAVSDQAKETVRPFKKAAKERSDQAEVTVRPFKKDAKERSDQAEVTVRPFKKDAKERSDQAEEMARAFEKAAKELDEHVNNVNIARVVGSTVSICGSVLAIAAPFTAGASVVTLAAFGSAMTTVGKVTSTGASVVGNLLSTWTMARCQTLWDNMHDVLQLTPKIASTALTAEKVYNACSRFEETWQPGVKKVFCETSREYIWKNKSPKAFANVLKETRKTFLMAHGINAGLSFVDLVTASMKLSKQTGCKAGDLLRSCAKDLRQMN